MQNLTENNIPLAVVLGSGLGESMLSLPKTEIISEDFNGIHKKVVFISNIKGKKVLIFSGRKHFYEGFDPEEITSNMKTANALGVRNVLLTNAAGGVNDNFAIGDMMLLKSHINLNQKLIFEKNYFEYSAVLYDKIAAICNKMKIGIHEGVYCCASGPAYETKAEIRMLKLLGCDAVGMSTVPEAMHAQNTKINVSAISVITNLLRENDLLPSAHDEIVSAASLAANNLFAIINRLLIELN